MKKTLLPAVFAILISGPLLELASGEIQFDLDWQTADRSSARIAPDPVYTPEAVVQVYSARAYNWRGVFAVHTWIATKSENADGYTVYQKVGWRKWRGLPVVVSEPDIPDKLWYGIVPEILFELRGQPAEKAISGIISAVETYPYKNQYLMWPGPNSNTFIAYIYRQVPELDGELPTTAVGKDFLPNGDMVAPAPSKTGIQVSLLGLLGFTIAKKEGIELNFLGLTLGVDPLDLAIKLPGIGQVGLR